MAKSKLRQLVRLPWAADGCPWVGKLRTVLPLNDRVIRDSAVPLWLTHQRGASGVESSPCAYLLAAWVINPRRQKKPSLTRAADGIHEISCNAPKIGRTPFRVDFHEATGCAASAHVPISGSRSVTVLISSTTSVAICWSAGCCVSPPS